MFRTLFARLSAALVVLSLVLSVALVFILQSSHRSFYLEIEQKLHRQLAERLAAEVADGGAGALEPALEKIRQLATLDPGIAAYGLSNDGTITGSSRPSAEVRRSRIALAPILRFIEGTAGWPLLAEDPAVERGTTIFSAARIAPATGTHYFYITLGSPYEGRLALPAGDRPYSLSEAVWLTLANIAAVLAIAVVMVALITRPIRGLRHAMETFDASDFAVRAPYSAAGRFSGHEIDRLGEIFDAMAGRIAAQIERLRRSDEARRELYENVSHDLKTPLTSLQGYIQTLLLKNDSLGAEQRQRYLTILNRQAEQLGEMVEQISDLARLETPALRLQLQEIRLADLLDQMLNDVRPQIEAKRIKIDVNPIAPSVRLRVDPGLMARALANVIVNAIQAIPEGGEIRIRVVHEDTKVAVMVGDSGPGLRVKDVERVFVRHYRGSPGRHLASPGMGLGLAITRKIIELHRGAVVASNSDLGGAELRISLPSLTKSNGSDGD